MHIGVVNAAVAAVNDELQNTDTIAGSNVERLCSVMIEKPSSKKRPMKPQAQTESKMNPAFDAWLENKLHTMFDAVAAEPLPPDLMKLLEQLDKKMAPAEEDNKK